MSWSPENKTLRKTFTMKSFNDIIKKLDKLTVVTDKMNHHPDFKVYGYKNIEFTLSTHSVGAVTEKDHKLAEEIDSIFGA
jgi:4a-hydroxytetrahydrobiopterin dehydratase